MADKYCAKCGSDFDLVKGGSGAWLCAYCRGAKYSDGFSRYRREAWRKQVAHNETNLMRCIAAANRLGISYGEYMARKREGRAE